MLALGMLSAFGPLSLDLYLPSLPRIATDLSTSSAITQLTLSGSLAGLAVGQLLAGPLSDRVGRRHPLLLGLIGFALLSMVCALAPNVQVLIVARVVQGLCGSAGLVISRAIVRDAFDDDRIAHVFSMLMLINGLAPVLAPLAGGVLLHLMPWRGLFWVLAGLDVAILILVAVALPETLPPADRHRGGLRATGAAVREVSADRLFVAATAIVALASAALFTYISLASFVLQTQFRLSASQFSAIFAANSIGIMLGGRINGLALKRFDSRRLLSAGLLTMTGAVTLLLVAAVAQSPLFAMLVPLFVAIGSLGLVLPNANALALAKHRRNAGTASALLGSLQYVAGAIAGPVVASRGASATAMAIGMAVVMAGAVLCWLFVLPKQPVD